MRSANVGPISEKYLQNIFEIVLGSFMTSFPLLNTSEILFLSFCFPFISFSIFHVLFESLLYNNLVHSVA